MATTREILDVLDRYAEGFEFPGFNNMNYETADSRLHAYRDGGRWALVIEELVDWPGAGGIIRLVFAMGDIEGASLRTYTPIEPQLEWDDDGDELLVPETLAIRGENIVLDHAAIDALCEEHDVEKSFAVLVHLIEEHRDSLFSTLDERSMQIAPGLETAIQLDEWAHPDVYGGPKPSESEAFRQLAEVLSSGDLSKYAPTEPSNNRDWKMWLESR